MGAKDPHVPSTFTAPSDAFAAESREIICETIWSRKSSIIFINGTAAFLS
jgi:hypothetical protein